MGSDGQNPCKEREGQGTIPSWWEEVLFSEEKNLKCCHGELHQATSAALQHARLSKALRIRWSPYLWVERCFSVCRVWREHVKRKSEAIYLLAAEAWVGTVLRLRSQLQCQCYVLKMLYSCRTLCLTLLYLQAAEGIHFQQWTSQNILLCQAGAQREATRHKGVLHEFINSNEPKPNYLSQSKAQSPSLNEILFNRRFHNEGKPQTPFKCLSAALQSM